VVLDPTLKGNKTRTNTDTTNTIQRTHKRARNQIAKKNVSAFIEVINGEWSDRQHRPIQVPTVPCKNTADTNGFFKPKNQYCRTTRLGSQKQWQQLARQQQGMESLRQIRSAKDQEHRPRNRNDPHGFRNSSNEQQRWFQLETNCHRLKRT
jgi:hypothetical protein